MVINILFRTALSLPLRDALEKLDNIQACNRSRHRQLQIVLQEVLEEVQLLPQVESQISILTRKLDDLGIGIRLPHS